MSAGKGSVPRNCFSARFRENYDIIFAKKNPDADITIEIERIIREEPDDNNLHCKLLGRTVPPHPEL